MTNNLKIVGISGTNGSGKDTLAEILTKDCGWYFVSVTDILRTEVKSRGLPPERKYTSQVSGEWRRRHGLGILIDKAVDEYRTLNKRYAGLAVSSLRNPGEADELHRLGGRLIWIDADLKVRYQRIESRLRGPEDHKSYEQFLQEEQIEMHHHGNDDTALNMSAVKAKADIFITNDSNDLEEFKQTARQALGL